MANEPKQLKFIADVAGIYESLNKLIADIKSMQASLVVNLVTPDGRPIDQILRGGMVGGGGGFPPPGGGGWNPSGGGIWVKRTPGERSDPVSGQAPGPLYQTEFQKLRQDNSSYQYLESQRAISNRQNAMSISTGGKDGNQFLSDKIAELSKANNPQLQGTIQAITSLKDKFDELGKLIAALNENEKTAIGDQEKLASISKEREDAVRSQQQILQSAGGFGQQNEAPNWVHSLIKGVGAAAMIEGATKIAQSLILGKAGALKDQAATQDLQTMTINAVRNMSANDIFTTLNPDARAYAAEIGGLAPKSAIVGAVGQAGASGATLGGIGAGVGGPAGAGVGFATGALGSLTMSGIGPLSSWGYGGHPYDAAAAQATIEALQTMSHIESPHTIGGEEYFKRAGYRTPYGRQFGMNAQQMADLSGSELQGNTFETGISEEDQLAGLSSLYRFRGTNKLSSRMANQMRNGISSDAIAKMASGLLSTGSTPGAAFGQEEGIVGRAVGFNPNNIPLAMDQAGGIDSLAAGAGGFSGPAGRGFAEQLTNLARSNFGDAMAAPVAGGAFGTMTGENNQRGGQAGLINAMAVKSVMSRFGLSGQGAKSQALMMALMRDPGQLNNPEVQAVLRRNFPGLNVDALGGSLRKEMETEKLRFNVFARNGVDEDLSRLATNQGVAGDIVATSRMRGGVMAGLGMPGGTGMDLAQRGQGIDTGNPLLAQMKAVDISSAQLAEGGLKDLNDMLHKIGSNSGAIYILIDAMKAAVDLASKAPYSGSSIEERNRQALANKAASLKNSKAAIDREMAHNSRP
jgi:hypothetical protein